MPSEQDLATQFAKDSQRLSYNPVSLDNINAGVQKQREDEAAQDGGQSEEGQAAQLAKQQQEQRQQEEQSQTQSADGEKKEEEKKNVPSIMLQVAIAMCLIRDSIWALSFIIAAVATLLIPPLAPVAWGVIILADIAILPVFLDRRFVFFVAKDITEGAIDPKDMKNKAIQSAATKLGLGAWEFVLLILPFLPFYTLILAYYISKYRKAPYIPSVTEGFYNELKKNTLGKVQKSVDDIKQAGREKVQNTSRAATAKGKELASSLIKK